MTRSPLLRSHVDSRRLARRGVGEALAEDHVSRLMGYRSYGHPLMALHAMDPGPVRHVITQMVVALLDQKLSVREAMTQLLARPPKEE